MTGRKIGVLGGTFDPIHLGHLIVAEDFREKLGLREVLFIPAGRPWLKLKEEKPISAAEHRLAMVRLAVASNPYFKVSTMEIDRPGLSYSIDTDRGTEGQTRRPEPKYISSWGPMPWRDCPSGKSRRGWWRCARWWG